MRRRVCAVAVVAGVLAGVGCGDDGPPRPSSADPDERVDPNSRAVVVTTEPCGDASSREASGVIVAPGRVVTAAHVVARSREVTVSPVATPESQRPADVVVLDLDADVAVLDLTAGNDADPEPPVTLTRFVREQDVRLVGSASSGTVDLVVSRPVRIDIDGRRLGERVERNGYELVGPSADGDSGAGVYDADGRLGAIVFARSDDRDDVVFAVEASAIADALDQPITSYRCDEARSSHEEIGS